MNGILKDIVTQDDGKIGIIIDKSFAEIDSLCYTGWFGLIYVVEIQPVTRAVAQVPNNLGIMVATQNNSNILAAHVFEAFNRIVNDELTIDSQEVLIDYLR